jgi:hypothetical protein
VRNFKRKIMNYYQTLTDVGSVNEQGQTVLCRMTEFTLNAFKAFTDVEAPELHNTDQLSANIEYAEFISRPVTLGDLVPTNEKGEVLEKPEGYTDGRSNADIEARRFEYEAAEKRVIFDCEIIKTSENGSFRIEDKNGGFIGYWKSLPKYFVWNDKIKTLEDFPNNGIELILKKR